VRIDTLDTRTSSALNTTAEVAALQERCKALESGGSSGGSGASTEAQAATDLHVKEVDARENDHWQVNTTITTTPQSSILVVNRLCPAHNHFFSLLFPALPPLPLICDSSLQHPSNTHTPTKAFESFVAKYETHQQALAAKESGGEFSFQRLEEIMAHRMRDEAARVAAAEEAKRAAVRAQSAGGSSGGGGGGSSGGGGGAKEPSSRETKLLQEVERYKVMTDEPLHKSLP
jgi:uncharacterized membrane protein YgcG